MHCDEGPSCCRPPGVFRTPPHVSFSGRSLGLGPLPCCHAMCRGPSSRLDAIGAKAWGLPLCSIDDGARLVPCVSEGAAMHVVEVSLPVTPIVRRAMRARKNTQALLKETRDIWRERHRPLVTSELPKLTNTGPQVKLCRLAGFCLCGPAGLAVRGAAVAFEKHMRAALVKDSQPRRLFDAGLLMLRFRLEEGALRWAHLSGANLSTMRMVLAPLAETDDDDMRDSAAALGLTCVDHLDTSDHLGLSTHWAFLRDLGVDQLISVRLCRLFTGNVNLGDFVIGRRLLVEELEGQVDASLWEQQHHTRRRQRAGASAGGLLALPAAAAPLPAPLSDIGDIGAAHFAAPAVDEADDAADFDGHGDYLEWESSGEEFGGGDPDAGERGGLRHAAAGPPMQEQPRDGAAGIGAEELAADRRHGGGRGHGPDSSKASPLPTHPCVKWEHTSPLAPGINHILLVRN